MLRLRTKLAPKRPPNQRAALTLLDRTPLRGAETNGTKVRVAGRVAEAMREKGVGSRQAVGSTVCVRLGGAAQTGWVYGHTTVTSVRSDGVRVGELPTVQVGELQLPRGATVFLPACTVDTPFGPGHMLGLSHSGSKVVALGWGKVYLPTGDTEVHDELVSAAAAAVQAECPKRKRKWRPWLVCRGGIGTATTNSCTGCSGGRTAGQGLAEHSAAG